MTSSEGTGRKRGAGAAAALVALALLVIVTFGPAAFFGFLSFDDNLYVTENPVVLAGPTTGGLWQILSRPALGFWHPLTIFSHMLDVAVWGTDPLGHHLTSILLHLASTLLLFLLLREITGSGPVALATAALFAVHPLRVEAVAWISARKELLSGFFWIVSCLAWTRYVRAPRGSKAGWYAGTVLAMGLGLMAKPMLVTLPFALLLLDWWPLGRLAAEKLPFLAMALAAAGLAIVAEQSNDSLGDPDSLPLGWRLVLVPVACWRYLRRTVLPTELSFFYPHPGPRLPGVEFALGLLALAAITALGVFCWRSRPAILTGWCWFLGTLVPVLGLVQVGSHFTADRYTYLPHVGLFLAVTAGLAAAGRPPFSTRHLGRVALLAVAAWSLASMNQARWWRDDLALYRHALKVDDANWIAHLNLAVTLDRTSLSDEALIHYRDAARLMPRAPSVHYNLGTALARRGRIEESAGELARAIDLEPGNARARYNLGTSLEVLGHYGKALDEFTEAAGIDPTFAEAHFSRGNVLLRLGRMEEGAAAFAGALRARPGFAAAHQNLGIVLRALGRQAEAETHLLEASRLNSLQGSRSGAGDAEAENGP